MNTRVTPDVAMECYSAYFLRHRNRDWQAPSLATMSGDLQFMPGPGAQLLLDVVVPEHEVRAVGEGPEDALLLLLSAVEAGSFTPPGPAP